jgi:alpha-beta hydrolase superfamily lysophospholipase
VVSVDLRGHGRSPGDRSYVERFDDYLLDVDALLVKAREVAAGRPVFLGCRAAVFSGFWGRTALANRP